MRQAQKCIIMLLILLSPLSLMHAASLTAVEHYETAINMYKAGNYTKAFRECQLAIMDDRLFAEAYYLKAMLWLRKGHYSNAQKCMQTSAELGYEKAKSTIPQMAKRAKTKNRLRAPAGLTGVPGPGTVDIRWKPNTDPQASNYAVYMTKTPGEWNYVMIAAGLKENYVTIDGLKSGETYYFAVASQYVKDPFIESDFSAAIPVTVE